MHRMATAGDSGIAMRRAKQAVAVAATGHAIVDQQLVDNAFGRVMTIGDDLADIGPAAPRPHPFAGPAAARIVADRARTRLDRDMVRRRAGERGAPFERRERPFAAQIADRLVDRGDAFARHDVDLAIVFADQQPALKARTIVVEIVGIGRRIAAEAVELGEDIFLEPALRGNGRGHAKGQKGAGCKEAELRHVSRDKAASLNGAQRQRLASGATWR